MVSNKNDLDVIVIIVSGWQDEIGNLIKSKDFIGNSTIYLSQKCYSDLKKEILLKCVNCKKSREIICKKSQMNILKVTVCNNNVIGEILYRVEIIKAFEYNYTSSALGDDRIILMRKPDETIGKY